MELGKLEIYRLSLEISGGTWKIYNNLRTDLRYNIGNQVIRSADSIGANIAEGYGRFHYKDSLKFYYNSRGSLWETKHWIYLMHKRDLISNEKYDKMLKDLNLLGKKLNAFIKKLKEKSYAK